MPIELECPGCGRKLRVGEQHAGKQARCPECQTIMTVPAVGTGGAGSGEMEPGAAAPGGPGGPAAARPTSTPGPAAAGGRWQMKTPEGNVYGPVSWEELNAWLAQGRISHDCQLLREGGSQWQWAHTVFPSLGGPRPLGSGANPFTMSSDESREMAGGSPYASPQTLSTGRSAYQQPHRGALILVLGILGMIMCGFFLGIPAWVMGMSDLKAMREGRMDPNGMGLTQAGMILGIVSTVLAGLSCLGMTLSCLGGVQF